MPTLQTDQQGNKWISEGGKWRPAEDWEIQRSEQSALSAAGESLVNSFGMGLNVMGGILRPTTAMANFEDFQQRAERQQELSRFSPQATAAGELGAAILDPLNLLVPGSGRAIRQGVTGAAKRGTMAERVAAAVGQGAERMDSAGAMAVDFTENPSALGKIWKWISDEFMDPQELTAGQRAGLQMGDDIGFSWLPGQREGQNLLVAGVKSHPVLRGAFDTTLAANRVGHDRAWLKAIGSDADEFTREALGTRMQEIGQGMDDLAESIGQVNISGELAQAVARVRKYEPALDDLLSTLGDMGADVPLNGKELMQVRSLLNQTSSMKWSGAQANPMQAEAIDLVIDQIDDIIGEAIGPESMRIWARLRSQWRNAKLLESPGVIGKNEMLSPAAIDNKLRSTSRTGSPVYRRNTSSFPGVDPDTQKAMKWTRVSNLFADNIGDSGTASRQYMQSLLNGDVKGIAQTMMLKRYLERRAASGLSASARAME